MKHLAMQTSLGRSTRAQAFKVPMFQAPVPKFKSYQEFSEAVKKDQIESVTVKEKVINVNKKDGEEYSVKATSLTQNTYEQLIEHDVIINHDMLRFTDVLNITMYMLVFAVLIMQVVKTRQGHHAHLIKPCDNAISTTFSDVAGIDEAKAELEEIVDFLKNPTKYAELGAKIPKGCLLASSPGTGKTLLARAVANEARVNFIYCSASSFIELWAGMGALRVRNIFKMARINSPCILFLDEIDSVCKTRSAGGGQSGNDERDQTLNQLLVEMDGFENRTGVIVMAATNRIDVLDKALLRPGRFDRIIEIQLPDVKGRQAILDVHTRDKPLAEDVDIVSLSKRTVRFSGAELENLANEAAINAARAKNNTITQSNFEAALDRIQIGLRQGHTMTTKQKELVAVHEAGHTITALYLSTDFDPIKKVSILGRGAAGGITVFEPQEVSLYSQAYLKNQLIVALGGRAAEEVIYGKSHVTSGASSDLRKVYQIARAMVSEFGFSDVIGNISYDNPSHQTNFIIEKEMQKLVHEAYTKAINIIRNNQHNMKSLVMALLEKETLDYDEIVSVVKIH